MRTLDEIMIMSSQSIIKGEHFHIKRPRKTAVIVFSVHDQRMEPNEGLRLL